MYEDKYSGSPFEENSSERVNDQQETISQYGEMHQETGNRYGSYDYRYNGTPGADHSAANQKARKKSSFGRTLAVIMAVAVTAGCLCGAGVYGLSKFAQTKVSKSQDGSSWSFSWSLGDDFGDLFRQKDDKSLTEQAGDEKNASDSEKGSDESRLTLTQNSKDKESEPKTSIEVSHATAVVTDVTEVAENVLPSVVSVFNNYTAKTRDWWGQTYYQDAQSTGSGIIIAESDDGKELLIATNNHVVEGEDSLQVQFIDNETVDAQLKGTDPENDLAVIVVEMDDLTDDTKAAIKVATLGVSDELKIGEPAIAIGNALGYGQSVTTGVISALNREIMTEDGSTSGALIQTDAAINFGNSGGALCNIAGEVIGINSNKIGGNAVEGMGYAIPIDRAVPIIEDLMNKETREHYSEEEQGYLGINGVSVTEQVAAAYHMPEGAYIAEIIDGSGAAKSDLVKGDIITAVNDEKVRSMEDLKEQLSYHAAGETITLTVERMDDKGDYNELSVEVTLSSKGDLG